MKRILTAVLLLSASLLAAERTTKYILHVSHVGDRAIAITRSNGGDPTGAKTGDVVIISCGN